MYQSTQVLSLSIQLKKHYIYGSCIGKSSKNLGVLHRVHVLYLCIGPCNLSTKCQKLPVQYSNLLNFYVDTIFGLPNLGTYQGMSTKSEDQKISKNFTQNKDKLL